MNRFMIVHPVGDIVDEVIINLEHVLRLEKQVSNARTEIRFVNGETLVVHDMYLVLRDALTRSPKGPE